MSDAFLTARGIHKRFGGVVALDGVGLDVPAGRVTAVIGENGAGKSTLMRILAGVLRPDAGVLEVRGQPAAFPTVRAATAAGIALIHQELELCDNLSVGANVWLGREPRGAAGWFRPAAVDEAARPHLERVGLGVDPATPLRQLPIGQRQLVEIAKALSQDARLLIMDEPTSSLSLEETRRLFGVVEELRRQGVAVLYISHRLAEVETIADRVVGLRDGRNSGAIEDRAGIDHGAMVRLMVGRDLEVRPRDRRAAGDAPVRLRVTGLHTGTWPAHRLDLEVRAGEIVGLAGLVGAGRSELLETLFGARPPHACEAVEVDGRPVPPGAVRHAVAAGMALVPEDRKLQGLVLEMSVTANLSMASLGRVCRDGLRGLGVLDPARERAAAATAIEGLGIRTGDPRQRVAALSGGNQQKVVLGRWLLCEPGVLLLDEPTRGVDIGAKDEIYRRMEELAGRGMAVLFASSEMAEILSLSDRVLVLCEGRLAGELAGGEATEERIMELATGGGTPS